MDSSLLFDAPETSVCEADWEDVCTTSEVVDSLASESVDSSVLLDASEAPVCEANWEDVS